MPDHEPAHGNGPGENPGAFGAHPPLPPEIPTEVLRGGGRADFGAQPFTPALGREAARQADLLARFAERAGRLVDPRLIDALPIRARGQEHVVRVLPDGQRVVKTGVPGREGYGLTPYLRRSREIGLRPGTPAEYLERLRLQNEVCGDDLRWEGVVVRRRAGRKVEIVVSQGFVIGARPTAAEIARYFGGLGFSAVAGQEAKTHYRPEDNIAVFDAHEGNLIRTPEGLVPIDVVVIHPDDLLLSVLEQASGEKFHGLARANRASSTVVS